MRQIFSHLSPGIEETLRIEVADLPTRDGVHHRYQISGFDARENPAFVGNVPHPHPTCLSIQFAEKPADLGEATNCITMESLLAACSDRLDGLQKETGGCVNHALALGNINAAMRVLASRNKRQQAAS